MSKLPILIGLFCLVVAAYLANLEPEKQNRLAVLKGVPLPAHRTSAEKEPAKGRAPASTPEKTFKAPEVIRGYITPADGPRAETEKLNWEDFRKRVYEDLQITEKEAELLQLKSKDVVSLLTEIQEGLKTDPMVMSSPEILHQVMTGVKSVQYGYIQDFQKDILGESRYWIFMQEKERYREEYYRLYGTAPDVAAW